MWSSQDLDEILYATILIKNKSCFFIFKKVACFPKPTVSLPMLYNPPNKIKYGIIQTQFFIEGWVYPKVSIKRLVKASVYWSCCSKNHSMTEIVFYDKSHIFHLLYKILNWKLLPSSLFSGNKTEGNRTGNEDRIKTNGWHFHIYLFIMDVRNWIQRDISENWRISTKQLHCAHHHHHHPTWLQQEAA